MTPLRVCAFLFDNVVRFLVKRSSYASSLCGTGGQTKFPRTNCAKGRKRANERRIEILLTDSSVIFLIIVEGIVFPPAQKGLVKRRLRHD